ncbi:MAG: hypothetical protein H5T33_00270 [Candidatus Methanosuratus sp.]|nr:hypothetical protein [Candidatus Methanosuratincola sp.]
MRNKTPVKCPNCGSEMTGIGRQTIRTGPVNEAMWLLVYPDVGVPVAFDAYVCEYCGKFELFADENAVKMLKGEYAGDELVKCSSCGKEYIKEYWRCPYCGAETKKG